MTQRSAGTPKATYAGSGVDIDAGNEAVKRLLPFARSTYRPEVLGGVGGFGALFRPDISHMRHPVLVSGTDGVGSKLKIAFMLGKHDTVGIDCVAMNADDVACSGAEPLFFLDYIAVGKVKPDVVADLVRGMAEGCKQAGCALIGGEIAELPDFYAQDEYDLAGFCVGAVDQDRIVDGSSVKAGDTIIGIASSGLHSNGYSLARKVLLGPRGFKIGARVSEFGRTLGEEMLEPTRIYSLALIELAETVEVKGLAHITGGGFYDNIPRCMSPGTRALIRRGAWPVPPVFRVIQEIGPVDEAEMYRVFNMGIGMVAIVAPDNAPRALDLLFGKGHRAWVIGEAIPGESGVDIAEGGCTV
jgi:phosphoribosylformylglycinamidine cyclo-ligase